MKKKLLTLDELFKFCQTHNITKFSSGETGYQLCVQVPATFEDVDDEDENILFYNVKLLHTGKNRNGSSLTDKAAKRLTKTGFAYAPILANFTEDEDGELDFTSHDMIIDDDGEINYIERQVGCFTTTKPYLKEDKDKEDRQYLYAQAAIPVEYTKTAEILKRKNGSKISAELGVKEMSYNAEDKVLLLEDVVVMGATLLGIDPVTKEEVGEGMEGARIDLADFSEENNSTFSHFNKDQKLIEVLEKLDTTLSNFNIDNNNQKGGLKGLDKFKELEVFDGEEVAEAGGEEAGGTTGNDNSGDGTGTENTGANSGDGNGTSGTGNDNSGDGNGNSGSGNGNSGSGNGNSGSGDGNGGSGDGNGGQQSTEPSAADVTAADAVEDLIEALTDSATEAEVAAVRESYDALTDIQKGLISAEVLAILTAQESRIDEERLLKVDDTETPESKKIADSFAVESYAVITTDGRALEFAVSMNDTIAALTELVNSTYSETDNAWYNVVAYDDHVVMIDWFTGCAYRQQYKTRKGVLSLVGDRVEVHPVYLTTDEEKALEDIKAKFDNMYFELSGYRAAEAKAKKEEIMSSDEYKAIFDKDEYKAIDIEEFSLDELKIKLDNILLKYAKEGNLNFSSTEEPKKEEKKLFGVPSKKNKKGRYGSIFKK